MQTEMSSTLALVRCSVGRETYGLDMTHVRGIIRSDRMIAAAGADGLVGFVSQGDSAIPVYSLAELLGVAPPPTKSLRPVVVLHADPQPWGLLVDRVARVVRVDADSVAPMPVEAADPFTGFFDGVVHRDGEKLVLLSLTRLAPNCLPDDFVLPSSLTAQVPTPLPGSGPLEVARRHGKKQLVLFAIADPAPRTRRVTFGLSISEVLGILAPLPLEPAPNAPEDCLGYVTWRDWPVKVVDLGRRLGLASPPPGEDARLLIARAQGRAELLGFLVRPAIRVVQLPVPHQTSTRDLALDLSRIKGCVELKNETLVLPDLAALAG
jgi:chemotaxis signal transduction protein